MKGVVVVCTTQIDQAAQHGAIGAGLLKCPAQADFRGY